MNKVTVRDGEEKEQVSDVGASFKSFDKDGVKGVDRVASFVNAFIKNSNKKRGSDG